MRIAVFALVLMAASTTARAEDEPKPPRFTESDRAVLGVLRVRIPEVKDLVHFHRITATPELDLVVAYSYDGGSSASWTAAFGAFLQRRDRPSLVYELSAGTLQEGTPEITIERATPTDLVLFVSSEQGNEALPTEKLVFDPRAKALVRHFQYARWIMGRAFPHGSGAVFLATDHDRVVAFDFDPTRERPFAMLSADAASHWSKQVKIIDDDLIRLEQMKLLLAGADAPRGATVRHDSPRSERKPLHFDEDEFQPVTFGKNGSFRLAEWAPKDPDKKALAVEETRGGETKHYPIPQSTPQEYRAMRGDQFDPEFDAGGSPIDEKIGGWDLEDGTLWVGKTFYDSEGSTGVGAFGWFDEEARTFRLSSPPEVRDYSISAMRVENDAIWMTLFHDGEWGDSSNRLARYDRATKTIRILPVREPGKQFLRVGDSLLLVTRSSVMLVSNDGVRSFFVDQTSDGRLRVVEAVGAER